MTQDNYRSSRLVIRPIWFAGLKPLVLPILNAQGTQIYSPISPAQCEWLIIQAPAYLDTRAHTRILGPLGIEGS